MRKPSFHYRKVARLRGHDYSKKEEYFITICTQEKRNYFGNISDGKILLNHIGSIAQRYLQEIPGHFSHVKISELVIMPNHVHFIMNIMEKSDCELGTGLEQVNQFSKPLAGSVSVIIQQYKSSVKRWCNQNNHKDFKWQSRFYDSIIKDEKARLMITNYIRSNPKKWCDDKFYNRH